MFVEAPSEVMEHVCSLGILYYLITVRSIRRMRLLLILPLKITSNLKAIFESRRSARSIQSALSPIDIQSTLQFMHFTGIWLEEVPKRVQPEGWSGRDGRAGGALRRRKVYLHTAPSEVTSGGEETYHLPGPKLLETARSSMRFLKAVTESRLTIFLS